MKKITGVFKYDCFPGMVVHDILGWDDMGRVKVISRGYHMKASALIAVFPKKQGEVIARYLQTLKNKQRQGIEELEKELLVDFFEKFPTLQKNQVA